MERCKCVPEDYQVSITQKELDLIMWILCDYYGEEEKEVLAIREKLSNISPDSYDDRVIIIEPIKK